MESQASRHEKPIFCFGPELAAKLDNIVLRNETENVSRWKEFDQVRTTEVPISRNPSRHTNSSSEVDEETLTPTALLPKNKRKLLKKKKRKKRRKRRTKNEINQSPEDKENHETNTKTRGDKKIMENINAPMLEIFPNDLSMSNVSEPGKSFTPPNYESCLVSINDLFKEEQVTPEPPKHIDIENSAIPIFGIYRRIRDAMKRL